MTTQKVHLHINGLSVCLGLSDLSQSEVDDIFEGTCEELTLEAVDFTQLDSEIVDGSTLLKSTDTDCCALCRTTPGIDSVEAPD